MANNRDDVTIPSNASKLLFAEDLVHYVIRTYFPNLIHRNEAVNRYERFRYLIYNGFNDSAKTAVEIIREDQIQKYHQELINMQKTNRMHFDYFTEYASNHRPSPFADEFQAAHFLMYCARVANMSGFLLLQGIDGAPGIAIDQIVRAFPEGDMSQDSWNKLNEAAETYLRVEQDFFETGTPSESDVGTDGSSGGDEEGNDANRGAGGNFQAENHL